MSLTPKNTNKKQTLVIQEIKPGFLESKIDFYKSQGYDLSHVIPDNTKNGKVISYTIIFEY